MQVSIENIVVLINSDRMNITDKKACCSYDILFPYILEANSAKAFLDCSIMVRKYFLLNIIYIVYILIY